MAYIRKRTTKAGAISTTLVEAYRDKRGRPRQRILANLYGAADTLGALVLLRYQREALQKHRAEQWAEAQSGEYDKKLVRRFFAKIDRELAKMDQQLATLDQHCTATRAEVSSALKAHKKVLHDAEVKVWGTLAYKCKVETDHKAALAAWRRLGGRMLV